MQETPTQTDRQSHYLLSELAELFSKDGKLRDFITQQCMDGFWFWDLENPEHEYMDDRFWEVIGQDPSTKKHLASEWQSLIHPDDLAKALETAEAHLADPNVPYDQIVRYKAPDGSWVHVRCRGVAIRDKDGKPVRMFGKHSDVTELAQATVKLARKERELRQTLDALARSEAELDFTFNAIPVKIWFKDDKNRIIRANEEAARSVNSTREALDGADTYELYPDLAAKYHADDLRVIQSGKAERGIIEAHAPKSGETSWVTTDKIPMAMPDGGHRLLVVSTDITELKKKEEQLAAMSQASRQFAAVAAHDLRAPLRQSALLMEGLRAELKASGTVISANGKLALDHVEDSLRRMASLVEDLHLLSKLETASIENWEIELSEILARSLKACQPELDGVKASISQSDLPAVKGSERLLGQVFTNLIQNACTYFIGDALELSISARRDVMNQRWLVAITDNGPGLSAEDQQRAFEPFTRCIHPQNPEGTGLGLAIVSRIMAAHGGRAYFDPHFHTGARVMLEFPLI